MDINWLRKTAGMLTEKEEAMVGTNCSNCMYTKDSKSEKVTEKDLNKQGGCDPDNEKDLKAAKEGDVITMPGKGTPEVKVMCKHPKIAQWVTERMCCAFWDSPGTHRAYGKQAIGK